jgi:trigger factor
MKKFLTLLLLGAILMSAVSCSQSKPKNDATTTTATQGAPEPADDTLMVNEAYEKLDLKQYVKLPALSELKISQADLDKNYDYEVKLVLENNATYKDTEEGYVAADGDQVNIHYKGYAANESDNISEDTLKNMTNMDYDDDGTLLDGDDLVLGSGSFIGAYESEEHPEKNHPGFEEQLVGMKAGETRTIIVTFPDSYGNSTELQGVEVKFDVTVNAIKQVVLPELTDDMVAAYTNMQFKTIADFKAYVLDFYKGTMAYDKIMEVVEFAELPTDLVDAEITAYVYKYIEQTHPNEQLTDAEIKVIYDEQYDTAKENAESTVESKLVLEYLCRELSVQLTYGEYKKLRAADFQQYAMYYYYYMGLTTEEEVEEYFGRDQMVLQYKHDKVLEILRKQIVAE